MKLYFYKLNTDERYGKVGITVQVCEAEEKPKTYKSVDRVFQTAVVQQGKMMLGE